MPQTPFGVDAGSLAARRLAAGILTRLSDSDRANTRRHEKMVVEYQQTPDHYVRTNGWSLIQISVIVLTITLIALWFNECLLSEFDLRAKKLVFLKKHTDVEDIHDAETLQQVLDAKKIVMGTILFRTVCRMYSDLFFIERLAEYEDIFKRCMESAMQQHMFIMVIGIAVIAGFVLMLIVFFRAICTPQLFCRRRRQKEEETPQ